MSVMMAVCMCHECDDGVFVCVMSVMMVCVCHECDDGVYVS